MPIIKSTYNFVPAPEEKEVVTPKWANQVSHDIPFSDGESGEIELLITAKTPIFIRNGHAEGKDDKEFSHRIVNGEKQYFIPGSSLKGMVRNVLEIITHSRMKQINDHRHAVRQIMRTKGTVVDEGYQLSKEEKKNILAGWLVEEDGKYFIVDCGRPLKIRYTDIDRHFGVNFGDYFGRKNLSEMDKKFSARTAKYKYENLLSGQKMEHLFENHPLAEEKQSSWVSKFQPLNYVQFSEDTMDGFMGTIVCVGQASNYAVSTSRRGEYVFRGNKKEIIQSGKNRLKLTDQQMEDFRFINRHNQPDELADWEYWKGQLATGIPVFFRKDKDRTGIKDLGLSFMYKQAVHYSTKEVYPLASYVSEDAKTYKPDWAETIFGYTHKQQKLKGRVFCGHLFQRGSVEPLAERQIVLSTPRSSFFPFYLKQTGKNGKTSDYNTYNHNPELAGFKRYPVKNKVKRMDGQDLKEKMITTFVPLAEEATFQGSLRFHNLRKAEIGALISALLFYGMNGNFYHSLGYAKSLGYGKIEVAIRLNALDYSEKEYLKAFEYEMTKVHKDWTDRLAIKELLAMATNPKEEVVPLLDYLNLKDFQEVKNKGGYLESYATISKTNFSFGKQLTSTDKAKYLALEQEAEQARIAAIAAAAEAKKTAIAAEELAKLKEAIDKNTTEALNDFLTTHPNTIHRAIIEEKLAAIRAINKAQKIAAALEEAFSTKNYHFDEVKKWPTRKLAIKGYIFSEKQRQAIMAALRQSYVLENENPKKSKFFKKKKLAKFNQFPWKNIREWLTLEQTKQLYEELTGLPAK